jgi:hypothetical protein
MPDTELPGAVTCLFCGTRKEFPEVTLRDMHRVAREDGATARLTDDRTALAAICPNCAHSLCPNCGKPVPDHQNRHGKVTNCDGTLRVRSDG